jgi:acetyl esterase/lipase
VHDPSATKDLERRRWSGRSLGLLAALLTGGCTPADLLNALVSRSGYETMRALAYGSDARQTLDVYAPTQGERRPVVVFFYGGSWQQGAKETFAFVAAALARRGFLTIVPDYRVYPDVRYPGFLEDGARAVRWARDHAAAHGGDPDRVFLMGHSAGAYIAAMLALDSRWLRQVQLAPETDVAGLVGVSGPYDFLPLRDPTLITIFAGDNQPATQPISYVTRGAPPTLLVTGAGDTTVDPGNSDRLAHRLRALGNQADVIRYRRLGHMATVGAFAAPLRFLAPVLDDAATFMDRTAARPRSARSAESRP